MVMLLRHLATAVVLAVLLALAGCADDDDGVLPSDPTLDPPEGGTPPPEDGEGDEDEDEDEAEAEAERSMERYVFDLVNEERQERGLEPLEWDDQLAELAREWSREMADEGDLEHQDTRRMLERSEGFSGVGENIYVATGPVAASTIHVGWMRSDGHRVNVLHSEFDRLGVGFVCAGDGTVWATQRFGSSGAPGMAPPDEEVPPEEPIVAQEGMGPSCPGGP